MTYGIFFFVEILLLLGYKIGLAFYLQSELLKPTELSRLQMADRFFKYYLIVHAFVSFYLLLVKG